MRRRFFLVFNPTAGTSKRVFVEAVAREIKLGGGVVVWAQATTAEAAREEARIAARGSAFDCILAAGGDGTIRQAAIAVADTTVPLGVIPLGTGNVLCHELNLPRRADAIARALAMGPTVRVTMGRANDEPFLLMAGAGFDGRVIAGLDHRIKNRIAKLAYVPPTMKTLMAPLDRLEVTVDGVNHPASWAVIANAERYGGAFRMAPSTHVTRSGLVAVLFKSASKAQHLGHLAALGTGLLGRLAKRAKSVEMIPCREARIVSATAVPCQIDGDTFTATPMTVTPGGGTLDIITGARS